MVKFVNEKESVMPFKEVHRWINLLESGKYNHQKNGLYMGNTPDGKKKMCCLGVLADMHGAKWSKDNENWPEHKCSLNGFDAYYCGRNGELRGVDVAKNKYGNVLDIANYLANVNDDDNTASYKKVVKAIKKLLLPPEAD